MTETTTSAIGKHVVVTTDRRGVFFGKLVEEAETHVVLEGARNVLYWGRATKGVIGLAGKGPDDKSRVGPAAPSLKLTGITSIAVCSDEAVKAWEAEPWGA